MVIAIIRLYQLLISPLLPPTCRFYPSCSCYAIEALKTYGFFKGIFLTIKRILRCNPWCHGGIDFIPGHQSDRFLISTPSKETHGNP